MRENDGETPREWGDMGDEETLRGWGDMGDEETPREHISFLSRLCTGKTIEYSFILEYFL